ncbi:unnamed protein product [Protopolystoma xenopodis]|uniref:Uncharacterized protein n=1 Tax=Protopolystoma xenopodis TaxID=117903 RepID=A0A448X3Q5_9PLAT|nr:unnamed protein product [Protopolystoma xenopodis]
MDDLHLLKDPDLDGGDDDSEETVGDEDSVEEAEVEADHSLSVAPTISRDNSQLNSCESTWASQFRIGEEISRRLATMIDRGNYGSE